MAKLIKKSLLLGVILLAIFAGFMVLSANSAYREKMAFWTISGEYPAGEGEVENYIKSIQTTKAYTKLILGDSVCNQLLNGLQEVNEEYCIVGNNRGVTIAGQYLLLNEFFKTHENVTDVYLIVGLDALETNIDITYGYQYVVIPFSRIHALDNLNDETLDEMSHTFGSVFLNPYVAQTIGDSNVGRKLYLNYLKQRYAESNPTAGQYGVLSEVTVTYLMKMQALCEEKGATLHLLPDPLVDTEYRHNQAALLETEFVSYGFDTCFPDYFRLIQYYPQEQFVDGVHFGPGYDTQDVYNEKIRQIYMEAGYLEGLCLDLTSN